MKAAFEKRAVTRFRSIDKFVDGAAVKCVGKLRIEICKKYMKDIIVVPEGKVCTTILRYIQ